MDERVKKLLSHNGWANLYSIDDPTFRQLTLEVLSTFEACQDARNIGARRQEAIRFQAFVRSHEMNHLEFVKQPVWRTPCTHMFILLSLILLGIGRTILG